MADSVSKSWFAVLNNPPEHGYSGTPEEVCNSLRDEWIGVSMTRTGAWCYCISAEGLHHVHMVLEDAKTMRFSAIKKSYAAGMHFEPTKGSKAEAEAYITKQPPYDEKGEQVVYIARHGNITATHGHRSDLEEIALMLQSGMTPSEIFSANFSYRKYERMVRSAYYDLRKASTPAFREVTVHYLVGASGSGKSHTYVDLCAECGEDSVYFLSDFSSGGFDLYEGQPILFVDEFKAQWQYGQFLSITDGYKTQIHARYANAYMLWNEVYITSVYPPEDIYNMMVPADRRGIDSYQQLLRRLSDVIYCYTDDNGNYCRYTVQAEEYAGYQSLISAACVKPVFTELIGEDDNPFCTSP